MDTVSSAGRSDGIIALCQPCTLTHTHTRSKHTPPPRASKDTRVKTEREKTAGLVDQVPVVSRVFPSLWREAASRLVGVCVFV